MYFQAINLSISEGLVELTKIVHREFKFPTNKTSNNAKIIFK